MFSANLPICLFNFSVNEVLLSLRKLKNSFTSGHDDIPSFLLRDCASVFAYPLTYIFNLSLKTSKFPDIWKVARICPVFKKDDVTNINNYRPISILSNFSKTFEMLLYNFISFNIKHYISPCQHGFVSGRSTITNLLVSPRNLPRQLTITVKWMLSTLISAALSIV